MQENKIYFHDQHDNEVFHGFFRKHWTQIMPPTFRFLFFAFFSAIAVYLSDYFLRNNEFSLTAYNIAILIVFFVIIFEVHRYFLSILSWFLTVTILTDFRIVEVFKTVYLHDEKEGVDLKKIQDIQMRKVGFLRNLLDFGRIYLTLASILDAKEIRHVPNVSHWLKRFNKIRRETITKKDELDKYSKNFKISQVQKLIESEVINDLDL